jgi:hypothetical protein
LSFTVSTVTWICCDSVGAALGSVATSELTNIVMDSESHKMIRAIAGPLTGSVFAVGSGLTIGRAPGVSVQLIGNKISRHHAKLRCDAAGVLTLTDAGSKNGTYVRGERITEVTLQPGDRFEIGSSSFVVEAGMGALPQDEMTQLSLMSGPVEDVTSVLDSPAAPVRPGSVTLGGEPQAPCQDPLHRQAIDNGWRFCPVCGQPTGG